MSEGLDEGYALNYDSIKETPSTKATLFVLEKGDGFMPDLEQWVPNSVIIEIDSGNRQVLLPQWFMEKEGLC